MGGRKREQGRGRRGRKSGGRRMKVLDVKTSIVVRLVRKGS